ncbi:MAG: sigma-70 family RNA polymerase sigma factor [Deltaproteobacteria bacterium]|nr:sigma-70 family RNA polymerase sigma factor [Deltaproteobacteria bacterium]
MVERAPNEAELDALMARLSNGDRSAFDPLFSALYPRALRVARRRVDSARAEDVAQTAMLKVFARAAEFEAGRPVLPWFYMVVANEVRAVTRGAMVRAQTTLEREDGSSRDLTDSNADPETEATWRELSRALESAVANLDATAAEAIYAVLGRGERPVVESPAFRKRVSRAYAKLRTALGGAYGN